MDEQWSFVGNKKQQRWLFYAWEPRFKKIIAHAFGSRSKETLKKLLERLARFKVSFYCTDDWQPYTSCLPEDKHIIGKYFTQRIERQNLTLRTCLKRRDQVACPMGSSLTLGPSTFLNSANADNVSPDMIQC